MKKALFVFFVLLSISASAEVYFGNREMQTGYDTIGSISCLPVFLKNTREKYLTVKKDGKFCKLGNPIRISGLEIYVCIPSDRRSEKYLGEDEFYNFVVCWNQGIEERTTIEVCLDSECSEKSFEFRKLRRAYKLNRCNKTNRSCFEPLYMPPKSLAFYYFYGCSYRNLKEKGFYRLVVSVEESSYYHDGRIKMIVKFLGNKKPSGISDFATWTDFFYLKKFASEHGFSYCPNRMDYVDRESRWAGNEYEEFKNYYYCLYNLLTKYLEIYTLEKTCGWWVITLFNDSDESRELFRFSVFTDKEYRIYFLE